nr:SDR family NAD(P)-dependent oxidoreductase [Clostridium sp.]
EEEIKQVVSEESNNDLLSLTNITYTMQVGRESMSERLSIIAEDVKDLALKLEKYINEVDDDNIFTGSIYEKSEFLKMMQDDFAIEDIFRKWHKDGSLYKIAKAWVLGADVDWRKVYDAKDAYCIPMPTYPFKKERYWIAKKENNNEEYKQKSLNALIDTNISTIYKQAYIKKFDKNDSFVIGHKVNNKVIVPGAALIEMAREAGELCNDIQTVIKVKDIYWLNELNVNEKSENVEIKLLVDKDTIKYEVYSKENKNLIYSVGTLNYADKEISSPHIDLNSIEERCIDSIDVIGLYNNFEKSKIQYGSNFRNIKSIKKNANEVIANIKAEDNNYGEVKLNPFILDAAFQTVKVLQDQDDAVNIPFSIDELTIYKDISRECVVYAVKEEEKYTIYMADYSGNILAEIKGFALKSIGDKAKGENDDEVIYYEEEFIESSLSKANEETGDIVVLGKKLENLDSLIELQSPKSKVIYLEDNIENELIQKMQDNNITHIIYNYSENSSLSLSSEMKNLGVKLLRCCKKVANIQNKLKIMFAFTGKNAKYYCSATSSFLKSVINENKRHLYKTVAFIENKNIDNEIINELFTFNKDIEEIVYEGEKRLIKNYSETSLLKNNENYLFKENGVYIITGGAGGLGLIFAKYIAEKGNCTVILVGRSELSSSRLKEIQAIKSEGVHYSKADISNLNDVENLCHDIRSKYGKIDGIIHSAGVIRDSFIKNKTEEELSLVIAPKINGLLNLDIATKNENLDYLISFSSIAAVLGNIGQVDYSFANGFIDAYLKERNEKVKKGERTGKSISVNWPLWNSGGMNIDEKIKKNMFDMLGVKALETLRGVKAFEDIILSGKDRVMVLNGKGEKLRRWVSDMYYENNEESVEEDTYCIPEKNVVSEEIKKDIKTIIKEVISDETKIPVSRIRDKEDFFVYGIDSVMTLAMGRELSKRLDDDLLTAFAQSSNVLELSNYILSRKPVNTTKKEKLEVQKSKPVIKDMKLQGNTRFKNTMSVQKIEEKQVAVIGISGRYPKADNIEEFWENLKNGKNCIEEIPKERWDYKSFYNNEENKNKVCSKWGGFIKDVDKFDSLFFNISPKEAELMDPQERIMLQEAWHALEDAGYSKRKLEEIKAEGKRVGVFIGTMYQQYPWLAKDREYGATLSGVSYWSIANRISYALNLNGPSMAIDTACSSSLSAVHMAKESIEKGECDIAIVGGVNLTLHPYKYVGLSNEHLLGSKARSMSLGDGDGYVPGEGAGVVILTALNSAEKNNDKIYCVIKASGLNHSGKTSAYKVPSSKALKELILNTFKESDIDLDTISYYELAANGLKVSDQVEIDALKEVFKNLKDTGKKLAIGSVKSNIGHLEAASGLSQLTKVILQLKNKQLVPSINCEPLNPNIDLADSCLEVQKYLERKEGSENKPLRFAIDSIGAGGTNSVLVVEEYKNNEKDEVVQEKTSKVLLAFSAKDEERLKVILRNTIQYLGENADVSLNDVSYTLYRKEYMEERVAFVVKNKLEFMELCNSYLNNNKIETGIFKGNIYDEEKEAIADDFDLNNIADSWVKGRRLLDDIYLDTKKYKLISIPLYPFEESSYWINDTNTYKEEVVRYKEEDKSIAYELKVILSDLLGIEVNKIDERKSLDLYGVNSILTNKFINLIEDKYGVRMSIKQVIDNFSIDKMSKIIEKLLQENIHNHVDTISHEIEEKYDYKYYLENLILSIIEEKNISIEDAINVKEDLLQFIDKEGKEYEKGNL